MIRKLLSILGTLAMLIAFLPGIVNTTVAAGRLPACCNGIMCPLHQMMGGHVICGANSTPRDGAVQSCPDQSAHYAGAPPFVRVAPSIFFSQRVVNPAVLPAARIAAKIDADVPFLPPRFPSA
jgi:hypothetical protein